MKKKNIYKNEYKKSAFLILIFIFILEKYSFKKLKVGIIGLAHSQNVGNNLVKYAISIILSKLSFDPHIIGIKIANQNISFLQQFTKVKIINNSFQEIKKI